MILYTFYFGSAKLINKYLEKARELYDNKYALHFTFLFSYICISNHIIHSNDGVVCN